MIWALSTQHFHITLWRKITKAFCIMMLSTTNIFIPLAQKPVLCIHSANTWTCSIPDVPSSSSILKLLVMWDPWYGTLIHRSDRTLLPNLWQKSPQWLASVKITPTIQSGWLRLVLSEKKVSTPMTSWRWRDISPAKVFATTGPLLQKRKDVCPMLFLRRQATR